MTIRRDAVISALEATDAYVATLDQRLSERLEQLTEQVGRLTEATIMTQNLIREAADRRDAQIDRLMNIVEMLIQNR